MNNAIRFFWLWSGWCLSATIFLAIDRHYIGAIGNLLVAILMFFMALRSEEFARGEAAVQDQTTVRVPVDGMEGVLRQSEPQDAEQK